MTYIASLDGLKTAITAITLAGGGDGFTFVVLVETAPIGAANWHLQPRSRSQRRPPPDDSWHPVTQVRCYLAANSGGSLKAEGLHCCRQSCDLGQISIPSVVVDQQVAGAAKGTRFMG